MSAVSGDAVADVLVSVDWQRVALHIRHSGMPLTTAARRLGVSAKHLQDLARGDVNEPRIRTALKLLALHADRCPDRHTREQLCRG